MYHTANADTLQCFAKDPAKSTDTGSDESFQPFQQFVEVLRIFYQIEALDIISCDVVSNTSSSVLSRLRFGSVKVHASVNPTGHRGKGGDWVLEMGDVDLIGRYFKANIRKVKWTLGGYAAKINDIVVDGKEPAGPLSDNVIQHIKYGVAKYHPLHTIIQKAGDDKHFIMGPNVKVGNLDLRDLRFTDCFTGPLKGVPMTSAHQSSNTDDLLYMVPPLYSRSRHTPVV
jgi:hypothetical protein